MKITTLLAQGKLAAHFGYCQAFEMVEVEDNEVRWTETLVPPPYEPGVLLK